MVKIGIDARLAAYRDGGIAEYTRHLIKALAMLDADNDYAILHHARAKESLVYTKNQRHVRTFTPPHHRLEAWSLGMEIVRLGLDILHTPDFIPPRFGAHRYVISVHDLTFVRYPQFQTADSLNYYASGIQRACRQASHILTISESSKRDICEFLKVAPEKVTVHFPGVDGRFCPLPQSRVESTLHRYQLPYGYFLFVGTFEPRKNLEGLLEAYAQLQPHSQFPPLVIVGRRGWLYKEIFERVEALKLADRVLWREDIPTEDLPAIYNGASVLIQPSFYEGFGLPPLEAMACGIPTVVANTSSLPEVVGQAGLLVDPYQPEGIAEGMRRAITDSAWRKLAITQGLYRAAQFTWQHTAQIALTVYHNVS